MSSIFPSKNDLRAFRSFKLTAQKMKFPIKYFFSKLTKSAVFADLVTFTEDCFNAKTSEKSKR